MTAEILKYTIAEVEALELAPGVTHLNLEGWIPELADEGELRQAMEKALDYRGDVTLTLKSGECVDGYIFNCISGGTLADSFVQFYPVNGDERRKVSYAEIARLEFTGKDRAAGKHWEDWVKNYNAKKAAGETNIALEPEALDE